MNVINKNAVRNLVREAFENNDDFKIVLDPFGETENFPVQVNPVLDTGIACIDVCKSDDNFVPRDGIEFQIAIKNLVKELPPEVIPHLYLQLKDIIKDTVDDLENDNLGETKEMKSRKQKITVENLRKVIRSILKEALDKKDEDLDEPGTTHSDDYDVFSGDPALSEPDDEDLADDGDDLEVPYDSTLDDGSDSVPYENDSDDLEASDWDPETDDEDDDDLMDPKAGKKKPNRQKKGVGYNHQNDGESFEEIAKKLGISVAGAKRLEVVALAKVEYLHDLDEKDRGEIIATAVEDYIKYLSKSGELSKEEVGLMKQHPEIVANLDGFREHLHKYVRNAMKADGKEFYPGAGDDE